MANALSGVEHMHHSDIAARQADSESVKLLSS
jgi:hypothetical protein